MLGKLKLREQGLLLIAVPLLFELLFVFLLSVMLIDLEKAAAKESQAKTVLSLLTELDQSSMASITTLTALGLSGQEAFAERLQESVDKVNSLCEQLRAALRDNPDSLIAFASIESHYRQLFVRILDLKNSYERETHELMLTQFANNAEYFEQLNFEMKQLATETKSLSSRYTKTVIELTPKSASFRTTIKVTIIAGIIGNVLLCIYLGIYFSRALVARVAVIIDNTGRFRDGRSFSPPLTGRDEIVELDLAFREMAASRMRSEQMRKDLVAMVSHDLRNPLTSVHGYVVLLLTGRFGVFAPEVSKKMERIDVELRRLIRMTQDLLDSEKIESGSLTLNIAPHDVSSLLSDSLNAVRALAEIKKVALEPHSAEELTCNCDGDRIVQVLVNLLLNAIRFAPVDSKIEISASGKNDAPQNTIEFSIKDQGPGISKEHASRIFERFVQLEQTTDQRRQGSGLGLAICKSLVDLHGGTIGVDSKEGDGSRFWFIIPNASTDKVAVS